MRLNKINQLSTGRVLFAYWANNKGRGASNCTLIIAPQGVLREILSKNVKNVIAKTTTSSWAGNVNVSARVCSELGITKNEIL